MAGQECYPQARDALAKEIADLRRQLVDAEHRNANLVRRISMAGDGRLRQILESAIDYGIIGMDLDGLVTSWNEGARRIMGWTEDEMIGQPASRFFTLEDRQKGVPQAEMQAALERGRGSDERWHLHKDGTRFWANGEMMPLKDDNGDVQGFVKILRDRTEQRLASERQRADAEFLRRVLEASGDCIKVLDLDARLIFMSEAGQRVMEVDDFNTIRGCPWPDFWQGALQADALAAIETAKAGGIGHFQGVAPTRTGKPRYWDVQVTPILGADGCPERLLSVSRDITDTRRAEVQRGVLLELGDRLREIEDPAAMTRVTAEILAREFHAASAGYATVTPRGGNISIEHEWAAPGFACMKRFPPCGPQMQALRQGHPAVIDSDTPDADRAIVTLPVIENGTLTALFFVTCSEPPEWRPEGFAFARDLVERTSAALSHRRTEQQVRDLAASLEKQVEERTRERDRIWRVSRDLLGVGTESGVWVSINPAWTTTLGWPETDIVGRTYEWLAHPDDLESLKAELVSLATGRPTVNFESRLKTAAGDYRWFSWSAVPAEGLLYYVGRDVTAEKERTEALHKTEEQLRQSQKMEAVGQLTGGLAHDFNNLLTGISGSLELLKLRLSQGRLDQAERYLVTAEGAAVRAAALTHRLLAFSRQQTLEPRVTQPNLLIEEMKDLIRRTVGPEIRLETILAADLWTTLCDPNQLENAILNLAINARDAMPDGGRLAIETVNATLHQHEAETRDMKPGAYVVVSVTDTGTGMAPDVVARAFDPFFTTKPQGQGTGLGLSMIYGFARQSGGQARITSRVGHGTTVRLYLPRYQGEEVQTAPPVQPAAAVFANAGDTVLIVDDEPSVRMLVTDLLEELGYKVIEAADGMAGLDLVRSNARIDLLITDVGLPGGVNGRQLAKAGRATRPNLKVLFVTGYAEDAATRSGKLEPGMAVLAKPFAMDVLASRIKTLISGD